MGVLVEAGHRRHQQPPKPAPGRVREDPRGHRAAQPVWVGLGNAGEQIDHRELVSHRPQRLRSRRTRHNQNRERPLRDSGRGKMRRWSGRREARYARRPSPHTTKVQFAHDPPSVPSGGRRHRSRLAWTRRAAAAAGCRGRSGCCTAPVPHDERRGTPPDWGCGGVVVEVMIKR